MAQRNPMSQKLQLNTSSPNLKYLTMQNQDNKDKKYPIKSVSPLKRWTTMNSNQPKYQVQNKTLSSSQYKKYLDIQRKKLEERTQNLNQLIKNFQQNQGNEEILKIHNQRAITAENPTRFSNKEFNFARNLNLKFSTNIFNQRNSEQGNIITQHITTNNVEKKKSSLEDYHIGKTIGQGAYAVCKMAVHKQTNKKLAIKIYDKYKLLDPQRKKSVKREIQVMEKLEHPNVVQLFDLIENSKTVNIIMDFVCGPSMHGHIKKRTNRQLEESEAKRIFKQIFLALQYCHSKNITHRDIKLENILLDELNNVRLIDFGFSTILPNDKKVKMFCGTPSYMAPEIVMKKEYIGPPVDI